MADTVKSICHAIFLISNISQFRCKIADNIEKNIDRIGRLALSFYERVLGEHRENRVVT